ncbi:MAG: NAD+ synthase [Planctomycetes bacterium]|nr:NAD+ synthase [Planctomycetota bacterium]
MKIALAQLDQTIGDLEGNAARIRAAAARARAAGADLLLTPELSLPGYPPRDLLFREAFVDANLRALDGLRDAAAGITLVVGFAERNPGPGRPLFNAGALLEDGRLAAVFRKSLLPTYDVFDEDRYFEPSQEVLVRAVAGHRVGFSICEDIWNDKDYWRKPRYAADPIERLVRAGAEVLVNISASPFQLGKQALRAEMLAATARKHAVPVLYVNLVGGNDDLVFDGRSYAFDATGRLAEQAASFEEDLRVVDLARLSAGPAPPTAAPASSLSSVAAADAEPRLLDAPDGIEAAYKALVLGIRDYAAKCGFRRAVLGLSGGIDSALTAVLAARALGPRGVLGVAMPSRFSSDHSLSDARSIATNLGIDFRVIPIEGVHAAYLDTLAPAFQGLAPDVTEENLQARIRGGLLMALSNKLNALLLSTGNKSELAAGYCTLYGDMCGGLDCLADVPKTLVYQLSEWINRDGDVIPRSSLLKAPSAELRPNQTDQDTLPPYDLLDRVLRLYVEEEQSVEEIVARGFDPTVVKEIARRVDLAEFKRRQAPPGLKITSRAFGVGRRVPIAQRWLGR